MDGRPPGDRSIDPAGHLRGALEKIVFFECRVAQLESELRAAIQTAERASADASGSHRKAVELEGALAAARGARDEAQRRSVELAERVRLLETERERLLAGLVEQARVAGAPGAEGDAAGEQADLAGFIAELRGELEELRRFKAGVESSRRLPEGAAEAAPAARAHGKPSSVQQLGDRFADAGRVGLTARDAGALRSLLATESDRVLFEEAIERLRADDAGARLRAVRRLEALGPRAAAPILAAAVGREPDAEVKIALLSALAQAGEPFAAELAGGALQDERPAVRAAALDALARLAPGAAEPRTLGALGDPSPIVRRRAALLLGFAKGAQADEALAAALRDGDGGVARAAAAALAGRPSAVAQQALARALEHADARVRRSAAESLGRWSGERVDGDAPDHERRRAARRIAERLAAMAPAEVRSAVVEAAERPAKAEAVVRTAVVATARPLTQGVGAVDGAARARPLTLSLSPSGREGRVVGGSLSGGGEGKIAGGSAGSAPAKVAARVAVAVVEAAADAGPAAGGLDDAILAELRAALRGRAVGELAGLLSAPAEKIEQSLHGLAARGAAVARGPRWYVG